MSMNVKIELEEVSHRPTLARLRVVDYRGNWLCGSEPRKNDTFPDLREIDEFFYAQQSQHSITVNPTVRESLHASNGLLA
jgi:hypothetical protein